MKYRSYNFFLQIVLNSIRDQINLREGKKQLKEEEFNIKDVLECC